MRRNHLQTAMVDPRDRIWRKMTFLEGMKWREVKREISDRSTNASSCTQSQHFLLLFRFLWSNSKGKGAIAHVDDEETELKILKCRFVRRSYSL